eukprot:Gb_23431 [translate_table: standard]
MMKHDNEAASEHKDNALPSSKAILNGRDESPKCVFALSAALSQPSSASGSMDYQYNNNNNVATQDSNSKKNQPNYVSDNVDINEAFSDCNEVYYIQSIRKRNVTRHEHGVESAKMDLIDSNTVNLQNGRNGDAEVVLKSGLVADGKPPGTCTSSSDFNGVSKEEDFDPSTYTFSAALRGSDSFSEYELMKKSAVISTPNRFMDRQRRPASMDLMAELTSKHQHYAKQQSFQIRKEISHKTMLATAKCSEQLSPEFKEDWNRKYSDYQGRFLRTFPSPGSSSGALFYERSPIPGNALHASARLGENSYINNRGQNVTSKSKWEDADKWLFNPVSGEMPIQTLSRNSTSITRDFNPRPSIQSTSGPIACPNIRSAAIIYGKKGSIDNEGFDQLSECSFQRKHELPRIETRSNNHINAASGLVMYDQLSDPGHRPSKRDSQISSNSARFRREIVPPSPARSDILLPQDIVHGNSEFVSSGRMKEDFVVEDSKHGQSDSKKNGAATAISPSVSTRDMGTQVTPLESSHASRCTTPAKNNSPARHNTPKRRSASEKNSLNDLSASELQNCHNLGKPEPQLDAENQSESTNKNTIISNLNIPKDGNNHNITEESSKCSNYKDIGDWKKNLTEARVVAVEEAERAKCHARFQREEAKISAWENHQKAKAETKLKKLEVKLEKLRANETLKIMKKLAAAEKKAEDMRVAAAAHQAEHMAKALDRAAYMRTSGPVNGNSSNVLSFVNTKCLLVKRD